MRSSLVGTRASRASELYTQDANVTDAAMVRRYGRTRDTLSPHHHRRWLSGGRRSMSGEPVPSCPATGGHVTGEQEPGGPDILKGFASSVVRHVKGSKRHLRQHHTCATSHAGTGSSPREGRSADDPCWHRGREAVVVVGVTSHQGHGSRRGRAKGLSRPRGRASKDGLHEAAFTASRMPSIRKDMLSGDSRIP